MKSAAYGVAAWVACSSVSDRLDFGSGASIPETMTAQPPPDDLDPMFDALLEALEQALDLASSADRDDRLAAISVHCVTAARLTSDALARR